MISTILNQLNVNDKEPGPPSSLMFTLAGIIIIGGILLGLETSTIAVLVLVGLPIVFFILASS